MAHHPSGPDPMPGLVLWPGRRESRHGGAALRNRLALVRAVPSPRTEERQMSVFTVDLKNQPGELARLCEAIAAAAST